MERIALSKISDYKLDENIEEVYYSDIEEFKFYKRLINNENGTEIFSEILKEEVKR